MVCLTPYWFLSEKQNARCIQLSCARAIAYQTRKSVRLYIQKLVLELEIWIGLMADGDARYAMPHMLVASAARKLLQVAWIT